MKMNSKEIFSTYLKKDSSLKTEEIELICSYFQEEFSEKETPLFAAGSKYKKIVLLLTVF